MTTSTDGQLLKHQLRIAQEFGALRSSAHSYDNLDQILFGLLAGLKIIRDRGELEFCKEAPAIYKFQSNPAMTHVDDFLTIAKTRWIRQTYIPLLEQEFQLSYDVATHPGDSFRFLKREHALVDDGSIVKPSSDYATKIVKSWA